MGSRPLGVDERGNWRYGDVCRCPEEKDPGKVVAGCEGVVVVEEER